MQRNQPGSSQESMEENSEELARKYERKLVRTWLEVFQESSKQL